MKNAAVALLWLCLAAAVRGEASQPEILILTTGGTIASRDDAPMIEGPALVQAVPQLLDHARVRVEEFSALGSSKITPDHWLRLAKRINTAFADDDALAGIVVTHGTDTTEETAYFLNLTVRSTRPVVLVGSMRSADEISADGPANLRNAVRVATHAEAVGQGVLVVLNENITAARDVWKTDNRRVHTFDASNVGHLGTVDPDGVRFYHRSLVPHTAESIFDVSSIEALPTVPLVTDYTGFDPAILDTLVALPMDGLVVRTFAGGRMSAGMLAALEAHSDRSVPLVVASRVPGGRIVSAPSYDFPAVVTRGQPDNKARILLMLALTRTRDATALQQIFDTY